MGVYHEPTESNRRAPTIVLYAGGCYLLMPRATLQLLLASFIAFHTQPNSILRVSARATVAIGPPEHLVYEPHLVADPTVRGRWLAASIVHGSAPKYPDSEKDQTCAAFVSTDDAKTWSRHDFPVTACGDPWTAITPDGQFLVSMVAASPDFPQQGSSGLLIFRSDDGGRTWSDHAVGLGRGHDHPVMVVDLTSSPHHGWVYVSSHRGTRADDGQQRYGVWLARSRDGGKTFDDPVTIAPNNLHNLAEMPVVLRDGTVVASFVDAGYFSLGSTREGSFDTRRAWVTRSSDGAHTFSVPLFVNDACGPPPGYRLSALAVDTSGGPSSDRLYLACRARNRGGIVVSASEDRGERWTVPVLLPAAADAETPEERIPGLAVNHQGVVMAAWIDGRSAPGHHCEASVFATISTDEGATWREPTSISSTPACDDSTRVANSTGGDYFGIAAAPDGTFRLLWSEMRGGRSELVTVSVSSSGRR
jgi:Neuraminidase (sialidase)